MDTRIFIMSHKVIEPIPYEGYEILQLGAAINGDLGYIRDDTGDNISAKNPHYCELTGLYWLWKNIKCDNIGVVHYRRFFYKGNKDFLDAETAERILESSDAIIPSCGFGDTEDPDNKYPDTIYEHYARHHNARDLDICRDIISEKYPEYVPAFDQAVKSGYLITFANMWITRKEIFDSYCEWLFDILFEAERRIDISDYNTYQSRIFGFLSERLFRVWLLMQPMKNVELKVEQIDSKDVAGEVAENDLVAKYVTLKLMPLFNFYQTTPGASLIMPHDPQDDFDGRIPVWVCRWQGEDDMPEAARVCCESLKRNLPADKAVIRFVSQDNALKYATFTEGIIARYQRGGIHPDHMTDMLRAELLYRYGGMWISPDYYVSKPMPEELFEREIFTLKFPQAAVQRRDVAQGHWSSNLWAVRAGHPFFKSLAEGMWFYFEADETPVSYYVADFVIRVLCERFPEFKKMLDDIPAADENVFYLQKEIKKRATKERTDAITGNGIFYRLDGGASYPKKVITEEETVYGWMTGQCS